MKEAKATLYNGLMAVQKEIDHIQIQMSERPIKMSIERTNLVIGLLEGIVHLSKEQAQIKGEWF